MTNREILIALSLKYEGNWNRIMEALNNRFFELDDFEEKVKNLKCKTVTMLDPEYPQFLKWVYKPPFVLYYYGDLDIISVYSNNVSIVGSRECSEYGSRKTIELASGLAMKNFTIVSGLAIGVDAIAHQAAIDSGGKTAAVLGCGIDYCYPLTNLHLKNEIKKNHLLISEYPGYTEPRPEFFPIRNRIIAGLSKTVIITEAAYKSGSLITALLALRGNADLMCVPYSSDSNSECNRLIMHGAFLVENVNDVLNQMTYFMEKNVK